MTVRRLKTYTAETGFVYQYYFVGKRPALPDDPAAPALEFVFDVIPNRAPTFAISVFLIEEALTAWRSSHGRELADVEHYAAAKMMLFRAFDSADDMVGTGRRLLIDTATLDQLLSALGVD